ncbi:hypothetical protein WEI85_46470 [Actinomycetes bacterium KLBMP 9797]
MSGSKWFVGRRLGGVLAALVVVLSLSAAGANASSPTALRNQTVAAAEPLACADERSATVTGVTVTMRPCLTTVTYEGVGTYLTITANLTFSTDPNEPVDLCRITFHHKVEGRTQVGGQELDCMELVEAGTGAPPAFGHTLLNPESPFPAYTTWATVEIVSVDGPVQAASLRFTFDGPF